MFSALVLSTVVIFVAELGDKSQLMAMTFATRYRARDVIIGITAATAVVHLASVGIGYFIGASFEKYQGAIAIVAGLAFLAFAAWTLRGDELTDEEAQKARKAKGSALLAVGVAFFLAELGDKTMLATITLAVREDWFGTWIGSTIGMVAADAWPSRPARSSGASSRRRSSRTAPRRPSRSSGWCSSARGSAGSADRRPRVHERSCWCISWLVTPPDAPARPRVHSRGGG